MTLCRQSTHDIALILLMKLFSKVADFQFGCLAPQNFQSVNGTCQLREQLPGLPSEDTATSWLYSARYLLPVLGGLLANVWLGYLGVLQLCGYIMLASTILLSIAVLCNFICYSVAIVTAAWALVPLLYGIIQPCIMYCLYRWYREPRSWTILTGVYYIAVKAGECSALLLPLLRSVMGNYFTVISIGLSAAFIFLTRWLHVEARPTKFEVPTMARMIRYCKIFTPMVTFSIAIVDSRSAVYSAELRHYLNATAAAVGNADSFALPEMVKVASQIAWAALLVLVAYLRSGQLPMQGRAQAGILLEALVSAGLLAMSLAPSLGTAAAARAIFSVASALDGAAEILTVSAAYEIMVGVAPRNSRLLVFGICFTVWGLATLAGQSLVVIFTALPADNPVLRPAPGRAPLFIAYHLTILLLLALSSVYFRFVTFPIVRMLFETDDLPESEDQEEEGDEAAPLIERTRSL